MLGEGQPQAPRPALCTCGTSSQRPAAWAVQDSGAGGSLRDPFLREDMLSVGVTAGPAGRRGAGWGIQAGSGLCTHRSVIPSDFRRHGNVCSWALRAAWRALGLMNTSPRLCAQARPERSGDGACALLGGTVWGHVGTTAQPRRGRRRVQRTGCAPRSETWLSPPHPHPLPTRMTWGEVWTLGLSFLICKMGLMLPGPPVS